MMVMIRMDNAARIRGQAKKYRKEAQDLGLELKLIHYDEQISLVRYLKRHGLLTVRQIRALEFLRLFLAYMGQEFEVHV